MSWQQPGGRGGGGQFNPSAQSWTPGQGQQQQYQQGGYQQGGYQQQGYGYHQGGYQQGYAGQGGYGGYQGGYQQGGYAGYQQGGYQQGYGQQAGYQQGGYTGGAPAPAGFDDGYQQPTAPAPVEEKVPEPSAQDKKKLTLDLGPKKGGKSDFVMPKKKGGKSLAIGGAKPDPEPVKEEPKAEEKTEEAEAKPASPTTGSPKEPAKPAETAPAVATATGDKKKKDKPKRAQKEYIRDPRPHFNVVLCGHVDAGKSTISGHLLADSGVVDDREMDKLKREAITLHREGWEYAYVMDVSEEERAKGKTHETGAAYFETKSRRVTILDAPGHKAFVPSMIGGASQADLCVLVISARTGEFETGFEGGGQTREHAMLLRACGVRHMICVINKMDDCNWDKERYDEIQGKLKPFLKQNGFSDKDKNLVWMPVSGLSGANLVTKLTDVCPWYTGPTLMEHIDQLTLPASRGEEDDLCVPLAGAYKDDGKVFVYGKVESGSVVVGDKLEILPGKTEVVVEGIQVESTNLEKAYPGDNVHIRVKGIDEGEVHAGYVLTDGCGDLRAVDYFQAKIVVLEVKNLLSNGSRVMMNLGVAEQEVSIHKILAKLDPKTHEPIEKEPSHVKGREAFIARLELSQSMVVEEAKKFDKLGRFMLREEGRTIALGVITKLYDSTRDQVATGTAPRKVLGQ